MIELTIFIKYKNDEGMDVIIVEELDKNEDNIAKLSSKMESIQTSIEEVKKLDVIDKNIKEIYGNLLHYVDIDSDGEVLDQFSESF